MLTTPRWHHGTLAVQTVVEAKPHWNWVAWANLEKSKRLFSGYFKQHIWYERGSFEGEARRWQSLIIWTRTDPCVCVCVCVFQQKHQETFSPLAWIRPLSHVCLSLFSVILKVVCWCFSVCGWWCNFVHLRTSSNQIIPVKIQAATDISCQTKQILVVLKPVTFIDSFCCNTKHVFKKIVQPKIIYSLVCHS